MGSNPTPSALYLNDLKCAFLLVFCSKKKYGLLDGQFEYPRKDLLFPSIVTKHPVISTENIINNTNVIIFLVM